MNQLLPEVKSIFEQYLNGNEIYIGVPTVSKQWEEFISLVEEIDKIVEEKKKVLCDSHPAWLRDSIKDALRSKKNNDRVLSASIALIAAGGKPWEFIDVLFALELMDFSVIIIDDILDGAERRANRPAHHVKWGISTTLTVSEMLKSMATQLVLVSSIPDKKKIKFLMEMHDIQKKVYEGQLIDVQSENKEVFEISIQDYLQMVSLTTGYQYRGFLRIGGLLSEKYEVIDVLGKIGMDLGVLGQIRDDLIDYIPDEELTWKSHLSDFMRNKKRLPFIIGWKNAKPDERERLLELRQNKDIYNNYLELLGILFKPQNITEIRQIILRFKEEGLKKLDGKNFTPLGKSLLTTYFNLGTDEI